MENEVTYEELEKELKKYIKSKKELDTIKKAYFLAKEEHKAQKRNTGEPYINHPLHVALILTTIKADYETICAGLLHDVLEDCDFSKEELEKEFGKTITKLVDGVTKINRINVSTENEYLTGYYKKIIVGMSEDVRVIIVKLADRLHNMRTLYAIPLEKQKRKAKETLEILTPIAERLGMYKMKSELEDLCLKYLKPDVYQDIVTNLNDNKIERDNYVNQMMNDVSTLLNENGIKHEIQGRSKSIYSIYKKMDKGKSFSNIYDLLAMRILVKKESECYLALGLIHSKYKPMAKRFKDYIAMPKPNLYRSLHTTVFGPDGKFFEVQIRTYEMDQIDENGIASHWSYKEGTNAAVEMQNITSQKLQFYKSIIELNKEKISSEEYIDQMRQEVLSDNIYVYTPKGDVFELPEKATPIDFAYRVHSKVGDQMTGAIVNDVMVPLSYELKTGDVVKIITNKNQQGPSREWLNIATTNSAKNKIKNYFNKTNRQTYILEGKESLEKALRREKIAYLDFMKDDNLNKVFKDYKVDDLDDLYLNIGNGKISAKGIVRTNEQKEEVKKADIKQIKLDNDIIVGDTDNIQTHLASCCLPVPGDEIIGYITRGNGITIHRRNCQNIDHDDERIIVARWNKKIKNKYQSDLIIYSNSDSKNNLMLDIVQVAANTSLQVQNINMLNKTGMYQISVYVTSLIELNKFITELTKLKNVSIVERINK